MKQKKGRPQTISSWTGKKTLTSKVGKPGKHGGASIPVPRELAGKKVSIKVIE